MTRKKAKNALDRPPMLRLGHVPDEPDGRSAASGIPVDSGQLVRGTQPLAPL